MDKLKLKENLYTWLAWSFPKELITWCAVRLMTFGNKPHAGQQTCSDALKAWHEPNLQDEFAMSGESVLACFNEHNRLSAYILNHLPHEIGRGNPQQGEGAVDVAIRLMESVPVLTSSKDCAYGERNALVAALSKLFPASLERHPEHEEWLDDWRWVVFINLPTGQVSWHIHDSEVHQFTHLDSGQRTWDGHTTEQKYKRLAQLQLKGVKEFWKNVGFGILT